MRSDTLKSGTAQADLAHLVAKRSLSGIFVGAGISVRAGLPTWQELMWGIFESLGLNVSGPDRQFYGKDLQPERLATLLEGYIGRQELSRLVKNRIGAGNPSDIHDAVARLRAQVYLTTNIDTLLEQSFLQLGVTPEVVSSDEDMDYVSKAGIVLYKAFGSLERSSSLRFGEPLDIQRQASRLFGFLRHSFSSGTVLTVGIDPGTQFFRDFYSLLNPNASGRWIALARELRPVDAELWRMKGVQVIPIDPDAVAPWLAEVHAYATSLEEKNITPTAKEVFFVLNPTRTTDTFRRFAEALQSDASIPVRQTHELRNVVSHSVEDGLNDCIAAAVYIAKEKLSRSDNSNIMFEIGYLTGKLGADRIIVVVEDGAPVPEVAGGSAFIFLADTEVEKSASTVAYWLNSRIRTR
jgi:hypothetical protein